MILSMKAPNSQWISYFLNSTKSGFHYSSSVANHASDYVPAKILIPASLELTVFQINFADAWNEYIFFIRTRLNKIIVYATKKTNKKKKNSSFVRTVFVIHVQRSCISNAACLSFLFTRLYMSHVHQIHFNNHCLITKFKTMTINEQKSIDSCVDCG